MATELNGVFETAEVTEAAQAEELQIFGVRCPADTELKYQTLDEALAGGTLTVTEVSDSGSVPVLTVTNNGESMVLLIAGEQLVGAKQNRVLNITVMVAPKSVTRIPVSCVERGRWGYRSRAFGSSGSSSHYYLRRMMSKSVSASYRARQAAMSDQGAVWQEVDRKLCCMGSSSGSAAVEQAYVDYNERLAKMLAGLRAPEGCNGVVFAFGGRIAGLDLFDKPETLGKVLPKLAKAYGIDALEEAMARSIRKDETTGPEGKPPESQKQSTGKRSWWPFGNAGSKETPSQRSEPDKPANLDRETVETWLRTASRARFEKFRSAGLGEDVRIDSKDAVGAGLVVDQQPVHVELFAEERQDSLP